MKRKVMVLSLGGSLIIPDKVDIKFLKQFKEIIMRNTGKYRFIIVCGGGSLARTYISALTHKKYHMQSTAGIAATRANAKFVSVFFDQDPELEIPTTIKKIKKLIKKQDIVFSGALGFKPKQTSDSNAAEIAAYFKTEFINLTNVSGLHDKNPKKFKSAKFIPKITWAKFYAMANKSAFKPGQHFVLDQTSAKIIQEKKVTCHILGQDMKQLHYLLKGKKFKGTTISG
ncbi:MAG: hypothetical protein KKB31_01260 [Nanoarchaeota archaeon]|nr:hypothetical protein [Nanoarchaeota archaeon]